MTETLTFDFITQPPFRESLEADLSEMQSCMHVNAHKSVHVIAGSIVEALLIDYLVDTNDPPRPGIDPLKLDLAEAVALCRKEGILSERSAELSSVVRGYRNLIHPGRVVRLNEPQPDAASASIAVNLVTLIVREMAKARKDAFGISGDQLLSKLVSDYDSLAILPHLLQETRPSEKERLLLQLIPKKYAEETATSDFLEASPPVFAMLSKSFRIVLDTLDDAGKQRVAREFARIVRDEAGDYVQMYGAAFFQASDMQYLSDAQRKMVKAHILATIKTGVYPSQLNLIDGIEEFIEPHDAAPWLDPILRTLVSQYATDADKRKVRSYYDTAVVFGFDASVQSAIKKRLNGWAKSFRASGRELDAQTAEVMSAELGLENDD